jgi:hypothetical protein
MLTLRLSCCCDDPACPPEACGHECCETVTPPGRTRGRPGEDNLTAGHPAEVILCAGSLPSRLTTTAQVVPGAKARTVRSTCSGDENGLGGRTCRAVPSLVTT